MKVINAPPNLAFRVLEPNAFHLGHPSSMLWVIHRQYDETYSIASFNRNNEERRSWTTAIRPHRVDGGGVCYVHPYAEVKLVDTGREIR